MQFHWSWNTLQSTQYILLSEVGRINYYYFFFKLSFIARHILLASFLILPRKGIFPSKEKAPDKQVLLATKEPIQLRTPERPKKVCAPCWAAGNRKHSTHTHCSSRWEGSCHSCTALCWARWHYNSHWPASPSSHRCSLKNKNNSKNCEDLLLYTFHRHGVGRDTLLTVLSLSLWSSLIWFKS